VWWHAACNTPASVLDLGFSIQGGFPMRNAAIVLGIVGGIVAALFGMKWLGDANEMKDMIESLRAMGADTTEIDALIRGGYCLILSLFLGVGGSVLTLKNNGKLGGALMLAGVVLPFLFVGGKAIVTSFFLLLGGILALRSSSRSAIHI
jgi:hypothetical protein